MSDKLIGKTLAGRFVLEELLGTGATGSVFRAQQVSVDRVVAVKTLHPFLQQREDFKARFEIEAKAIARLNHPNCITIYDFGYDDEYDVFYMAVEYIKGDQLADLMESDLPAEEIYSIAYQVADALEHAHREGILHRDLKPENIMIQVLPDSGRLAVKVLDFGLARLYETEKSDDPEPPTGRYKQITQAGQVYGTPAYMSPEQCRANTELTPATDVYALGTMMFELLEGHLPFFSKSTAELIMMQMTEAPPRMKRIDVPPDLRDLIFAMMAKDPAARPQSAREVLLALLPHVRLDASQEFRILPNASGELTKLTPEQLEALTKRGIDTGERKRPSVETLEMSDELRPIEMELSNDELRSARSSGIALLLGALAVVAVVAVGFVFTETSAPSAAPVAVDSAAAAVADSPRVVPEGAKANQLVEVAENAEKKQKSAKTRSKPSPKAAKSRPAEEPAAARQLDAGAAPVPAEAEADRPKTLKLTY